MLMFRYLMLHTLFSLQGEKWRELRRSMSPMFTTGKLRKMSESFKESNEEFFQLLENTFAKSRSSEFDVRRIFDGLVMDMICRSAFGIKIGDPLSLNNRFIKLFKELQGTDGEFGWMYTLSMTFPFLAKLSPTLGGSNAKQIADLIKSVMHARRESNEERDDFIDILNAMAEKLDTQEYKKLHISETSVLSQAINFVLAGYDAMCTTMTFLLYYLAKHPEIQRKLLAEVDSFIQANEGEIAFEKLSECVYLQACLNETLRLCPPFIRPERICTKDWEHKSLETLRYIPTLKNFVLSVSSQKTKAT